MFKNIGGKIKMLAKVICIAGIIVSIIWGIYTMIDGGWSVLYGFIRMFIGSFLAWISSFFAYGFGELISNSDKIVKLISEEEIEETVKVIKRVPAKKRNDKKVKEKKEIVFLGEDEKGDKVSSFVEDKYEIQLISNEKKNKN